MTDPKVDEIREWLERHEATPPIACLLCDEPVDKDTVIEHLMEEHEKLNLAVLVALWWFMDDDEEQSGD